MSGAAGRRHNPLSPGRKPRVDLMASLLDLLNKEDLLNMDALAKAEPKEKFDMISQAIFNVNNKFSTVHDIVNEANDGLDPRSTDCEEKLTAVLEENTQLRFELDLLKGLFFKMEAELDALKSKTTSLSAFTMKDNIVISGLEQQEDENPVDVVTEFFTDKMELEFPSSSIIEAKRIGIPSSKPNSPRLMVATLNPSLRQTVLSNKVKLKDKTNSFSKHNFISKQLPDEWVEENRVLRQQIKKTHKANEVKSEEEEKDKIQVKSGTLYVNQIPQKKGLLQATKAADIFVDKNEQEKIDHIKLHNSSTIEENGSTFMASVVKLQSLAEVK